jgi:hypothetical protein
MKADRGIYAINFAELLHPSYDGHVAALRGIWYCLGSNEFLCLLLPVQYQIALPRRESPVL